MDSKLTVRPVFDYETVEYGKNSEVHLDVILQAPEKEGEKRTPLQMILALDCSGSMSGQKLESVKSTVLKMIEHMTENDTVGILGFSDNVWDVTPTLPMTQENKAQASSAVRALDSRQSTNISDAITMAWERAMTAEKDKISRIILLTDGLPNVGISDHEGLVKHVSKRSSAVALTCFGYGSDYNPELLTSLSKTGRGNNFYIENDDDCRKAFALELGGLLSLYAQDIKISVKPSGNMKMKELLSFYEFEDKPGYRGITSGQLSVTVDDIYHGEKKHIVLKMEIPQASEAVCARPSRVCGIEVDYLDVSTKDRIKIEDTARIQYVKTGKAQDKANEEVRKQLMMLEAARIQKEAKEKADAGDYDGAKSVIDKGIQWAEKNVWWDNAGAVRNNLVTLSENCTDRFSYAMKGSKLVSSYVSSYSSGRGASGDTICASFTSSAQQDMLAAFTGSTTGEVKFSSSTSENLVLEDKEEEDEKKDK